VQYPPFFAAAAAPADQKILDFRNQQYKILDRAAMQF
jgi:hypothetical protein